MTISPDGRGIMTGSSDKTAEVRDSATGREALTLKRRTNSVNAVALSPDGGRIVSGSEIGTVKV